MRRGGLRFGASLAAALLLTSCASEALQNELRVAADKEIARAPANYTHGKARAWLIRKDGAERGLIWGTMHVGYSGEAVLPAPIRARFYDASDLTVETVLDRLGREETDRLRKLYREANEQHDPAVYAGLNDATRSELEALVPASIIRRSSLRGLANEVSSRALTDPLGALPVVGFVDLNLISFARGQDREVLQLETPQTPDPTLRDPNGEDAAAMLQRALRRAGDIATMGNWARVAYGRGDIAHAVAALIAWRADAKDLRFHDRNRPALMTERNAAWLIRLEEILSLPGQHFIAVGAGHLLGEDGIVALLQGNGYQVTPCVADAC